MGGGCLPVGGFCSSQTKLANVTTQHAVVYSRFSVFTTEEGREESCFQTEHLFLSWSDGRSIRGSWVVGCLRGWVVVVEGRKEGRWTAGGIDLYSCSSQLFIRRYHSSSSSSTSNRATTSPSFPSYPVRPSS
ncbi:hypothetical protein M0802_015241 [Mischocyttarus mexicanus]|nr:hypothetical protein M0802_015241 [Mischocyttarus mexicanus]